MIYVYMHMYMYLSSQHSKGLLSEKKKNFKVCHLSSFKLTVGLVLALRELTSNLVRLKEISQPKCTALKNCAMSKKKHNLWPSSVNK